MEAGTVPDKAVISHRGEKYEIGRGKRFYGIWVVGAPYDAPVDRWPENDDGWQQAWARFTALEVPGTIKPLTRERKGLRLGFARGTGDAAAAGDASPGDGDSGASTAGPRSRRGSGLLAGEALLVLGVVLGLAGLFPAYEGGQSLLSQWDQVVPHLLYVIGWAVTAAMVALSVARPSNAARLGALFGLGLSAVTFGLFLADWGQLATTGVTLGNGLVVSTLGWVACTAGAGLVLGACKSLADADTAPAGTAPASAGYAGYANPGYANIWPANTGYANPSGLPSRPVRPGPGHAGPLALLVLAAIGTAVAFAPSWDRYVLTARATGASQIITAGNAFDNPGLAIAGNVCVMVAIVAVAALAGLWRPARHGSLLLAGAIVPLAAQIVSALIQVGQATSPSLFGFTAAQASSLELTISNGVTGIFWVYFVFVISLLVSCAWLFTEPGHPVMPGYPVSPWQPAGGEPGTVPGTWGASGAPVSEDADRDASEDADWDAGDDADWDAGDDADSDVMDTGGAADSGTGTVDSGTGTGDGEQSAYA